MGEAVFDDQVRFLDQPLRAAAVLCRTEHGNLHAGLLYHNGTADAVVHLGWQDTLDRSWPWARLWATPDVEPEQLMSVAGFCRRIWRSYERTRRFPYGIRFAGSTFDERGRLRLGPGARGLTCATFVLAVFRAVGVDLVDESDWPVREEDDRAFLATLARFATEEHFALLQGEVDAGVVRVRPDEVLGACACALPAEFAGARAAADRVSKQLDLVGRVGL
ncbi:hypothetical protein [Haliangium sp.]|uniref:hypothetical protein n=1 Tax=Haliangium sp. TaxID=2663208 RepID=UPI003D09D7EA